MGYELFRLLSLRKTIKSKKKRPDDADNERNRVLVEEIYSALVKPGPDLVTSCQFLFLISIYFFRLFVTRGIG